MVTKQLILQVLKEIHPETLISVESQELLIHLFSRFDSMLRNQILDLATEGTPLRTQMEKHATKEKVIDYLLSEIIELSGNRAADRHHKTITAWDVWACLEADQELRPIFSPLPKLPIHRNTEEYREELKGHWHPTKKMINEALGETTFKCSDDVRQILYYILLQCNQTTSVCLNRISQLGAVYDPTYKHPVEHVRTLVLQQIITDLQNKFPEGKITFSQLEQVVNDLDDSYDFIRV